MPTDPTLTSEEDLAELEGEAIANQYRTLTIDVEVYTLLSLIAAARAVRRVEALRDELVAYVSAGHSIAEQALARRILEHVEAALTGAKT